MQTSRVGTIKMTALKLIKLSSFTAIALYVLASVLIKTHPQQFFDCERDTKLLNGGVKVYDGKKLNVVLCGAGPDENMMNDKIRLQVFAEDGDLLAQRTFYVHWDTNADRELVYNKDHLTYFDASQNNNYIHHVRMPPTWLDWIKARLPLMN
ncbi:hypothetical protein ACI2VT_16520 [Ralstonia nicotianae]